jgi:hypothetical protein
MQQPVLIQYLLPWAQYDVTFYGRNIQMFVKRQSVCPWHSFPD